MATFLNFLNRKSIHGQVGGSDGRLNTSSRSSQRIHYISRDDGQAYTVTSHDATAAVTTYSLYLQNTSTSLLLYLDKLVLGGVAGILWKVWFVTGTAAGGSLLTAVNMNKSKSTAAAVIARGDDAITGLTTDGEIISVRSDANSHDEIQFDDAVILGQNDAIAIEADAVTSTAIAELVASFYMETSD